MAFINIIKKLAGAAIKQTIDSYTASAQKTEPVYETDSCPTPGAPAVDLYSFRGSPNEYFSRLLAGRFPEYEIRTNLDPSTMPQVGGNAWTCRCGNRNYTKFCAECGKPQPREYYPITFMMYRNNFPVLAIILCDKQRANVRKTIRACETMRVPCQCYYTHFRNAASYVEDRIRTELR